MSSNNNQSNGGGKPARSLLDIQAEQKREQQQQQRLRGGGGGQQGRFGGGGGGGGGARRNNNNNNTTNNRGRGGGNRGGNRQYDRLPIEQGCVASLKESFGFIYCAFREEEIFFHYSQCVNGAAELRVDDEVEFRVGSSDKDKDKLAAFQVRKLEKGTVVWETVEDGGRRFRGLVERSTRFDRGSNIDGTIKMLVEKETSKDEGVESEGVVDAATGPVVKFTVNDYVPVNDDEGRDNPRSRTSIVSRQRLSKGDLVEFSVVTSRRNQTKYARDITMLLSERDRLKQEQEERMLAEATIEHGVVTSLKGEYGFLKSNKRREEVYFHYSSISFHEGDNDSNDNNLVLQEGQEMKFLVVDETPQQKDGTPQQQPGRNPKVMPRRLSARQVIVQPRGSVKFHDALAHGVTGIVTLCPQPMDSGHSLETRGRVVLEQPIVDKDSEGNERTITEVYLTSKESPGGTFSFRGGSSVACWIEVGDRLLFDVVKDFVDGACHAAPTKYLVPNPSNPYEVEEDDEGENPQEDAAAKDNIVDLTDRRVRLIDLSLVSRAEGVINAVRETYGFIHFAERPVDVHFKLFQLLPDDLQTDIRRNKGYAHVDAKGKPLRLSIGTEVQFDISVHGTVHSSGPKRGTRGNQAERENLKAQRVLFLPPGTIQQTAILASKARGTVSKEDPRQAYAGMIDLDEAVQHMSPEVRHPLVSQMIDKFLASPQEWPLVYHDVQSAKEDEVIFAMIEAKASGKLEWSHIPMAGLSNYPGKLCIRKAKEDAAAAAAAATAAAQEEETAENEESPTQKEVEEADGTVEEKEEAAPVTPSEEKRKISKKRNKAPKQVKTLRFDKTSLSRELREDMPPGLGDIVEFDVVQARRTGQVAIENLRIIERKKRDETDASSSTSGVGIVKEIVAPRNFGFISVLDDTASNREMLFFSLSNVTPEIDGPNGSAATPSKRKTQLRKGDEVMFDIITEKNGKRVALNVTPVRKGTIPNKADKNACKGIILLEPSYTSLKNTPDRSAKSSSGGEHQTGRWKTGDDGKKQAAGATTEDGVILLLEDPAKMFSRKAVETKTSQVSDIAASSDVDATVTEATDVAPASDAGSSDIVENVESVSGEDTGTADSIGSDDGPPITALLSHLRYKSGALAIVGAGASTAPDGSSNPKRGDIVSFAKAKGSKAGIRDIRLVNRGAATLIRGRLENISLDEESNGTAVSGCADFIASTEGQETYQIALSEVVSCEPSVLKEKEPVEGILHENHIYGICRTVDLYLESKLGANLKERPKLNLTVKKDRGGTIMAQSMMAKGPDGTHGFAPGWTTRTSKFATAAAAEANQEEPPLASEDTAPVEAYTAVEPES